MQAAVHGGWTGTVYSDPSTGKELGRRGENEGLFNRAFKLHTTLFSQDIGPDLLTAAGRVYFPILASPDRPLRPGRLGRRAQG